MLLVTSSDARSYVRSVRSLLVECDLFGKDALCHIVSRKRRHTGHMLLIYEMFPSTHGTGSAVVDMQCRSALCVACCEVLVRTHAVCGLTFGQFIQRHSMYGIYACIDPEKPPM